MNAASGALFVISGIAVFVLARRRAEVRLLGVTIALWGFLEPLGTIAEGSLVEATLCGVLLVAAVVLAWRYPAQATRTDSWRLAVALALCVGWSALAMRRNFGPGRFDDLLQGVAAPPLAAGFFLAALAFLPTAFALRALTRPQDAPRLAPLTLVFGLYGAYNGARIIVWLIQDHAVFGPLVLFHLALNLLPAALWLVVGAVTGEGRRGRNVALAIAAAALAGAAVTAAVGSDRTREFGVPGALQTVAWAVLAFAVLRRGLLGRDLPRIVVARGPLAAGALAALFVVAQVAQNFFSAEYGLLTGGIVAGAFLFMAQPLQRMAERLATGERAASSPAPASRPEAEAGREDAYRSALRFALRDRVLTRAEELHLHEIAEHMGISGRRAHELLMEIEAERGGQGAP